MEVKQGCPRGAGQSGRSWPAPGGPGVSVASRRPRASPLSREPALMLFRMRRGLLPQRFDQRGHVTPVFGRQLVDAGDQELSLPPPVTRVVPSGGDLVVIV